MIQTPLLRTGDIIGLTGKVRHNQNNDDDFVFIDIDGHHTALMLKSEKITLIAPRIDVGERVRWTNGSEGVVKAADGDKLWVLADTGQYVTWPAKEVTVLATHAADPDPVEAPPAPLDGKVGSEEPPEPGLGSDLIAMGYGDD